MAGLKVQPYLYFGGRCEEALAFYQASVGAQIEMSMRFRESPDEPPPDTVPENWGEKIMHASMRIGNSRIMLSDGCGGERFGGFALSLQVEDEAAAQRLFSALADGGEVTMPLTKTFWSPQFGMLTDRFGVAWMVNVATEGA